MRVLEILASLPNARCIKGNTDRYVCTGRDRPPPTQAEAAKDPTMIAPLVECAGSFAWTQGCVTAAGWLDWIDQLPPELSCRLPDGARLLGVHASPGNDDGPGLRADWLDADLQELVRQCEADIILAGHTHMPMDRIVGDKRLVNLGSVSNPRPDDLRASYAVVTADAQHHTFEHRRVDYDRNSVIADLKRLRHPAADYIIRHLSGGVGGVAP